MLVDEEDIPAAAPDSYIELPIEDGVSPQLWDPYTQMTINTEDELMPGLSGSSVASAIRSYYRRLYPTEQVLPLEPSILIAGRMWSDSIIYSSRLYRTKKHLVTRSNNYVLFESGVHGRTSPSWFVGEVFTYFEHEYNNERRFLGIVNVMKEHRFGEYYIPQVIEDPSRHHFAVLNVADIIQCVGLMQYSDSPNKFNVVWSYMDYQDKIGNREPGGLSELL
ncbi:unnamed protein product [Rhizopus stolonifer]